MEAARTAARASKSLLSVLHYAVHRCRVFLGCAGLSGHQDLLRICACMLLFVLLRCTIVQYSCVQKAHAS
jgi:hypothetical protein